MRVTATAAACRVVQRARDVRAGQMTITIGTGCCESTAPFLYEDFWPGPDQEQVGEVAGVPVFAPEYLRANYPNEDGVTIDVVQNVLAESMSIETEFSCRLILRAPGADFGVDAGADDSCVAPRETAASIATGGPSRVVGELPEPLRRLRMRG
ncbi:MAG: DUF779 domain-containing protein [Actinobacteria bacterium]|nr:DUF779 domain-containing protein [Actinomycetota bacterium]